MDEGGTSTSYVVTTADYKMVCDYAGLSFLQIQDLYCDEFRLLLRDAFIYKMQKTQDGREYLEDCKRFDTTTPDRQKLREKFRKEGE